MEQVNQLIFVAFGILLLGILTSTLGRDNRTSPLVTSIYWPSSLILRSLALFGWALVPYVGNFMLDVANAIYIASTIALALLFRSWNNKINPKLIAILGILLLVVMIYYHYLRLQPNTFADRVVAMAIPAMMLGLWQIYEIYKQVREDKSFALRILIATIVLQITLAFIRMLAALDNADSGVQNLIQSKSSVALIFIASMSANLLGYVMVSSYQFQKLWQTTAKSLDDLTQKTKDLRSTQEEKRQIEELNKSLEALMSEKNQLVQKMTMSSKASNMGAMVSSLAHELNQPLGTIKLNSDFLEQRLKSKGDLDKYEDILRRIQQDGDRASNIVTKLRQFFYSSSGKFDYLNLSALVDDVILLVLPELKTRKISLENDLPEKVIIFGDSSQLQMVIVNLLNNAMEALRSNVGAKKISIHLKLTSQSIDLDIIDNGPGVDAAATSNLFELFHTTKEQGMGVGLWLSRSIMELHGGNIQLVNPGKCGAIFRLHFPIPAV